MTLIQSFKRLFTEKKCFHVCWQWPFMWRSNALRIANDARRFAEARVARELVKERQTLTNLIGRVVSVRSAHFTPERIYQVSVAVDASMFQAPFYDTDRRMFAEYVSQHIAEQLSRCVVVGERHP